MNSFITFWLLVIIGSIVFMVYWILKKYGKQKLGISLACIVITIFATPILSFVFEDYLFFKSDATELLKEHKFELYDEFELKSNKIMGLTDYYHCFEVEISTNDKDRLVREILESTKYKKDISNIVDFKPKTNQETIVTYQNQQYYIYEYYARKKDHSPIQDKISISKIDNHLIYERMLY